MSPSDTEADTDTDAAAVKAAVLVEAALANWALRDKTARANASDTLVGANPNPITIASTAPPRHIASRTRRVHLRRVAGQQLVALADAREPLSH